MTNMPWRSMRALSQALVSRRLDLTVEGLEHLPHSGAAIIAARHYHHLYDGAALLATIPRRLQVLVAADWAASGPRRTSLEAACKAAGWPVVHRAGRDNPTRPATASGDQRHLLRAIRQSVDILASGGLLLVFPEGYPNIDPGYTAKTGPDQFLPFEAGFARIAAITARRTGQPVPIIPAGFRYQPGPRWQATLRFGPPVAIAANADLTPLIHAIEHDVRRLSQPTATPT